MKDLFVHGTVAGFLGTAGDFIIHHTAKLLFKTSTTTDYIAHLVFPFQPIGWFQYAHGTAIHFFAGAVIGLLLVEVYNRYGTDYPYYKALSIGISLWIIHVAVIPNIINLPTRLYLHRTALEAVVDLLAHIAYGLVAAAYLKQARNKFS